MRKNPLDEGKRWLDQAVEDLKWAKDIGERGGYHISCFLAQQVGEKALKAFLYAKGEEVVLGHSVERLCSAAAGFDKEFAEKLKTWSILDSYYVSTRYPNGLPDGIPANVYTSRAALEACGTAQEVVNFIKQKISFLESS
jgi:HEPN domain-containing protein